MTPNEARFEIEHADRLKHTSAEYEAMLPELTARWRAAYRTLSLQDAHADLWGKGIKCETTFRAFNQRLLEYENARHNVIESLDALTGWEVISLDRWKPGVVRFHATRGREFQMGFAKDELFAALQLPP